MKISLVAKLSIAVVVFYWLAATDAIDFAALTQHRLVRWDLMALVVACLGGGLLLGGVRWWLILRAADVELPLRRVLGLQLIGAFFSTWLPGAAGGDAARGLYLMMDMKSRRATALMTVVLDRIFALFGLVAVATFFVIFSLRGAGERPVLVFYGWLSLGVLIVGCAATIALVAGAYHYKTPALPNWLERWRPIAHRGRHAVRLMSTRWLTMVVCGALSCAACMLVALGIVVISAPYDFAPSPSTTALAGVIGNISSAIPITPGGLGVGEAVFSHVATELSGSQAPFATIYLTFRVWMALVSSTGAIVWLCRRAPTRPTIEQKDSPVV